MNPPAQGQVTLRGTTTPAAEVAPYPIRLSATTDQVALITLTAASNPTATNSPIATLSGGPVGYSVMPVATVGSPSYFSKPVHQAGDLTLTLHNRPVLDQPEYPQAVT
ncbi:MAG TPA: hypothetical protein VEI97_02435 [bacterium]|nr:hypothetical protein [bacterium]